MHSKTPPSPDFGQEIFEQEELAIEAAPREQWRPYPGSGHHRQRPLTREKEVELAKRIEGANRALLDAVVRSPTALSELVTMLEEERGERGAPPTILVATEDVRERRRMLLDVLEAARRARARRGRSRAKSELDAARDGFVETTLRYGLSPRAVNRLFETLSSARDGRKSTGGTVSEATLAEMSRRRTESERAKAFLVEANSGLVIWMASKKTHPGLPLADLIQEGTMGLMRAVDKFDHRRGVRFSTYAAWWIRHYINRALSDHARTIRIPVHLLESRHQLSRFVALRQQLSGRVPTERELSDQTGVPAEKLRAVSSLPTEPVSLEASLGPDSDRRLADIVEDPQTMSALDETSSKQLRERLEHLLGTLPPREREVLKLRFGIDHAEALSLADVGRRLSLSRERIRQIEAEALSKLHRRATEAELDSYLSS